MREDFPGLVKDQIAAITIALPKGKASNLQSVLQASAARYAAADKCGAFFERQANEDMHVANLTILEISEPLLARWSSATTVEVDIRNVETLPYPLGEAAASSKQCDAYRDSEYVDVKFMATFVMPAGRVKSCGTARFLRVGKRLAIDPNLELEDSEPEASADCREYQADAWALVLACQPAVNAMQRLGKCKRGAADALLDEFNALAATVRKNRRNDFSDSDRQACIGLLERAQASTPKNCAVEK